MKSAKVSRPRSARKAKSVNKRAPVGDITPEQMASIEFEPWLFNTALLPNNTELSEVMTRVRLAYTMLCQDKNGLTNFVAETDHDDILAENSETTKILRAFNSAEKKFGGLVSILNCAQARLLTAAACAGLENGKRQ
jgi:hypothetical protein